MSAVPGGFSLAFARTAAASSSWDLYVLISFVLVAPGIGEGHGCTNSTCFSVSALVAGAGPDKKGELSPWLCT